jgi:hypothetical protein
MSQSPSRSPKKSNSPSIE